MIKRGRPPAVDEDRQRPNREWAPALRAAGIPHRTIYSLRHTYATHALAANVPTLTLAQVTGTSVGMLEGTYLRWLKQTADSVRELLDAADRRAVNECAVGTYGY